MTRTSVTDSARTRSTGPWSGSASVEPFGVAEISLGGVVAVAIERDTPAVQRRPVVQRPPERRPRVDEVDAVVRESYKQTDPADTETQAKVDKLDERVDDPDAKN